MRQAALSEHELQASIIAEVNLRANLQPEWGRIFAVPNGGHRDIRVAAKLKAEGVRAGVPDLLWPLPRGKFIGMAMELKVRKNRTTAKQSDWLEWLTENGWFALTVYDDPQTAIFAFEWYYNGANA